MTRYRFTSAHMVPTAQQQRESAANLRTVDRVAAVRIHVLLRKRRDVRQVGEHHIRPGQRQSDAHHACKTAPMTARPAGAQRRPRQMACLTARNSRTLQSASSVQDLTAA